MKAYNVIGKVSGSIVTEKRGLTFPAARELQKSWEQRGCGMIVDEQHQQVKLDRVEIEPVEVLWSRGEVEEAKESA
jgi:hypothetical protein